MRDENLVLNDVSSAFRCLVGRGTTILFGRGHRRIPGGGHLQGIQRKYSVPQDPPTFVISASSRTVSYFVTVHFPEPIDLCPAGDGADEGNGLRGGIVKLCKIAEAPLVHAGGIQIIGDCLVVGIEDNVARNRSRVLFYDISEPAMPRLLSHLTIEREGEGMTAGAIGIVKRAEDHLMVVGRWDAEVLDFYRSNGLPLADPGCRFTEVTSWVHRTAHKEAWRPDTIWGKHQNLNLVRDRAGSIHLFAFNRNNRRADWIDLFEVEPDAPPSRMIRKIDNRRLRCRGKVNFRFGGGICILSPDRIVAYACAKKIQALTPIEIFRPTKGPPTSGEA
ncbi:MAG: hypothetical protein D6812_08785 [Deltaproteobacteria bacterium]|nr:MAG: hypothetical protein D6812_08785 [Deltaproteobacteria bacterium]